MSLIFGGGAGGTLGVILAYIRGSSLGAFIGLTAVCSIGVALVAALCAVGIGRLWRREQPKQDQHPPDEPRPGIILESGSDVQIDSNIITDTTGRFNIAATNVKGLTLSGNTINISSPPPAQSETLLAARLQEIRELESFIGNGTGEAELRGIFDLTEMMKHNILLAKHRLARATQKERRAVDEFFANGKAIWTIRNGYSKLLRDEHGGPIHKPVHGKIGILNTSSKYEANKSKLAKFRFSVQLPGDIRDALTELDKAVYQNVELMFDVINEKFAQNARNLTDFNKPESRFRDVMWNDYCDRFIQLVPKRDDVVSTARNFIDNA